MASIVVPERVLDWWLLETLGEGTFGIVKLAVNSRTNERIAIKIIPRGVTNADAIEKEFLLHRAAVGAQKPPHNYILGVVGRHEDAHNFYLLLEYAAGGELFDRIEPERGFESEDVCHAYFTQLVTAVDGLHARGIAHRDLKPENVLLDEWGAVKLADFGFASLFVYRGERRKMASKCGSEIYMAPQVFGDQPYEGDKADVWSLGVILYVMVHGRVPWDCPDPRSSSEFAAFVTDPSRFLARTATKFYAVGGVTQLLAEMLRVCDGDRPTLADVRASTWFRRRNPLIDAETGAVKRSELLRVLAAGGEAAFAERENDAMDEPHFPLSQPALFACTQQLLSGAAASSVDRVDLAFRSATQLRSPGDVFSQQPSQTISFVAQPSTKDVVLHVPAHMQSHSQSQSIVEPFSACDAKGMSGLAAVQSSAALIDTNAHRLTRFYSLLPAADILQRLQGIFDVFLIPFRTKEQNSLIFQTVDRRKCLLCGEVLVNVYGLGGQHLVIFRKSRGDAIEFKKLFYAVVQVFVSQQ